MENYISDVLMAAATEGIIAGFNDFGDALVEISDSPFTLICKAVRNAPDKVKYSVGDQVLCIRSDMEQHGYLLGIIEPCDNPESITSEMESSSVEQTLEPDENREIHVDGKRIHLEAAQEMRITCGEGAIIIKEDGKVIIRGTNIVSRATGANKVKGSSIRLN